LKNAPFGIGPSSQVAAGSFAIPLGAGRAGFQTLTANNNVNKSATKFLKGTRSGGNIEISSVASSGGPVHAENKATAMTQESLMATKKSELTGLMKRRHKSNAKGRVKKPKQSRNAQIGNLNTTR